MSFDADTPWLLPLLALIRVRPGMYLGHENIRLLSEYLAGYLQARVDLGLSPHGTGERDHLRMFQEWLRVRQGKSGSSAPWYALLETMDPTERNIATFFQEFRSYLADNGIDLQAIKPMERAGFSMSDTK